MCQQLMTNYEDGKCNLTFTESNGQKKFTSAEISGKVKPTIINQVSEDIHSQKSHYKMTLMIILGTCLPLVVMLVVFVLCVSHRCKPYSETQRPLTDELQAVENGYHDNPTLEVMEVQGVEPEKKMALNLNGEFNDSWIVPMDNLLKDDGPDEEDTHL
ncbi:hypothetical protein NL108_018024 [Boleophthalmus pectinirostris]|uniref:podocalyxin n=1 Tax=Boleophthalmus pectinirostris TaxID=150288 RepID=UPI00242DD057|nr:podocalyxin [Boleophthalmus pectinirostris]KAJ0057774.1 hypothetical protein NL108_018024 [Boleophthalmus pectinirostris]